jgi:hypothetical protein
MGITFLLYIVYSLNNEPEEFSWSSLINCNARELLQVVELHWAVREDDSLEAPQNTSLVTSPARKSLQQ